MAIHSFPAWKTGTRGRPHTASHALSVERAILICGAICSSNWRSQSRLVTSCKDDRRENGASKAQQQVYLHMSAHLGKNCKRTRGRTKNGVCTKTTTDAGWPSFRCVCRLAKTDTIIRRGHTNVGNTNVELTPYERSPTRSHGRSFLSAPAAKKSANFKSESDVLLVLS